MLLAVAVLMVQAATGPVIEGRGSPAVHIPRIEADITVDGVLDEPVWSQAVRLGGFWQYEPVDGRPAEERTEVLVWYAPDAICFGIIAYDRQPDAIRATRTDRDNIDGEDHVVLHLDTFNDRRRAYFFAVNALGIQQDGIRSEGAASAGQMFGTSIDRNPDFVFESRGRLTDQGYQVEVRIPFETLRYAAGDTLSWGFNVLRKVQRTGYTDTWTDARRANASFLVQAGSLEGLHDLQRGLVLEAQPFMTAKANGSRTLAGGFEREDVDPDLGLNLRLGFTNLTIDATLNPDFSQVESDAAQVTVNERFALFFPEKRPFFLEGIDLFNTPNQLVYTRRIANPLAGGKLTGKAGPFGVALISALDEGTAGAPDAWFNVTRLRRDFGSNSLFGITYTDRSELDGPGYNRVLAADARIVFARLYFVETQLGRAWSRTPGPGGQGTLRMGDPLMRVAFDRTGRHWGFNYTVNAIGTAFRSDAGFVPRNDIVEARGFNRLSFYGARGALLETFTVFFGPSRIWRYGDIGAGGIEGRENANLMFRLRGGWQLNSEIARNFVRLDPATFAGFTTSGPGGTSVPYHPLREVSGPGVSFNVTTPTGRLADASARLQRQRVAIFAEGSEGNSTQLTSTLNLRPTASVRVQFTNTFQRITRTRDDSEFARTVIPRARIEFQPERSLFFRTVAQYTTERRAALADARTGLPLLRNGEPVPASRVNDLRVDFLVSFEPSPGTVAFFGYGASFTGRNDFNFNDLERTTDGFFLKLAWQFRR